MLSMPACQPSIFLTASGIANLLPPLHIHVLDHSHRACGRGCRASWACRCRQALPRFSASMNSSRLNTNNIFMRVNHNPTVADLDKDHVTPSYCLYTDLR